MKSFENALQILRKNEDNQKEVDEEISSIVRMRAIPGIYAKILKSLGKVEIELGEYKNAIMYLKEGLTAQQQYFAQQSPSSESDRTHQAQQQQTVSSFLDDLSSTKLSIANAYFYLSVA